MTTRTMNVDKENRAPQARSHVMPSPTSNTTKGTPARRRKTTHDQYFDVGKVGRKTGITLPDNGLRDEFGFEPIDGIFSSPVASPPRRDIIHDGATFTSSDMQVQHSSTPGVERLLHARKTPRLPPLRALTPRHTNIGSPKRMSTGPRPHTTGKAILEPLPVDEADLVGEAGSRTQPRANRVLNFSKGGVRRSIEGLSPFKPTRALRRSLGEDGPKVISLAEQAGTEEDDAEAEENVRAAASLHEITDEYEATVGGEEESEVLHTLPAVDEEPLMIQDDSYQSLEEVTAAHADALLSSPPQPQPGHSNHSPTHDRSSAIRTTPTKKRNRTSMESIQEEPDLSTLQQRLDAASATPSPQKKRGKLAKAKLNVLREDSSATIDPQILAPSPSDDQPNLPSPHETSRQPRHEPAAHSRRATTAVPKNRSARAATSPVKLPSTIRGVSLGPTSNFSLRATTPCEDAGARKSRSGRNVIKPLQYWANETRVWRDGEVDGIVRAEEVVKPGSSGAGGGRGKKGRKTAGRFGVKGISRLEELVERLENIDEEAVEGSGNASTAADEWEEAVGVIAGEVASWDAANQAGNAEVLVTEDLAFAAPSLLTRPVAGADFQYAKILTLPFFGAGVVELPPAGFKRAKNARKMCMVFFVHAGKVMVEVGAARGRQGAGGRGGEEEEDGRVNQFAIAKGGVWVVPRGNNYAITNESRTKTARIFFAQGCEVPSSSG